MNAKQLTMMHRIVIEQIKPILAGHPPELQGSVLADLLAYWLAGWPAEARQELLNHHLKTVWELVPHNAREIRGLDAH